MKSYDVSYRKWHTVIYSVEANNEEEAKIVGHNLMENDGYHCWYGPKGYEFLEAKEVKKKTREEIIQLMRDADKKIPSSRLT